MKSNKTNKEKPRSKEFESALSESLYKTIHETLSDVLKTEYKTEDKDGKEIIDWEMTCRMIRTKARVALDFVSNLENKDEK